MPPRRDPSTKPRDDADLMIAMLGDGAHEYAKGLARDARAIGDDRWRHYERVAEEIARVIRVAGRSVRRWGAGEQDVPYAVALAIRLMAQAK